MNCERFFSGGKQSVKRHGVEIGTDFLSAAAAAAAGRGLFDSLVICVPAGYETQKGVCTFEEREREVPNRNDERGATNDELVVVI